MVCESAKEFLDTHKFSRNNYVTRVFPEELKHLLVPEISWERDERTSHRTDVIYFGYPKDFSQMKPCPDKPRKKHMNVECEIRFIVETVRSVCSFTGIVEMFPSLLYVSVSEQRDKSSRIGFLPSAFTFGGIGMCPFNCIVGLLDEYSKKRSAMLVKNGNVSKPFETFRLMVATKTSHTDILDLCNTMYPKAGTECAASPIPPSPRSLIRRCSRVTPENIAPIVQILAESGAKIEEDANGEALIDMNNISDAGKRKLDAILPPEEGEKAEKCSKVDVSLPSPCDPIDQEELSFQDNSGDMEMAQQKFPEELEFELGNTTTAEWGNESKVTNLQKSSNSSFIAFSKATELLEAQMVELEGLTMQFNIIKAEMAVLAEMELSHTTAVNAFQGSFNPASLQEMIAKLAKLAEDAPRIQEGKAKMLLLSVNMDKLADKIDVVNKNISDLRIAQQDACKTIVSCSNEIQKMIQ